MRYLLSLSLLTLSSFFLLPSYFSAAPLPPELATAPVTPIIRTTLPTHPRPYGVWTWGGNPTKDTFPKDIAAEVRGSPINIQWEKFEPAQGQYAFNKEIRAPLEALKRRGMFAHITFFVAPNTPRWLYENAGVPEVKVPTRLSPQRKVQNLSFPYYFDTRYQKIMRTTVKALADYLAALPADLKNRVVYFQIAEGSTGDGDPYKGAPIDPKYEITRPDWNTYRRAMWAYYKTVFQRPDATLALPLLMNGDANTDDDNEWLLQNFDNFGLKQGMFSHGYLVSDAIDRLARWEKLRAEAAAAGRQIFSRGEQDGEWNVCGWCKKNPPAALYWGALFALHNKLDFWNMHTEALATQPIAEALRLFNRYAGYDDDPATSPGAFCALRRGLNAADTTAFPEATYGKADRGNTARYLAIQKAHARYGAVQEDPEKASAQHDADRSSGAGMKNRQAEGQNDVGWNILPGNLERFLTQLRPEETSQALWHIEPAKHPYSMFARRFDAASGRVAMTFRLADNFFPKVAGASSSRSQSREQDAPATIRVAYLDKGRGTWSLVYATAAGEKIAQQITNTDTNEWRDLRLTLPDALWDHRLPGGGDIALRYVSGADTIFHIIELARAHE